MGSTVGSCLVAKIVRVDDVGVDGLWGRPYSGCVCIVWLGLLNSHRPRIRDLA